MTRTLTVALMFGFGLQINALIAAEKRLGPADNRPPNEVQFDGLVGVVQLQALLGQPARLLLKSGLLIDECVLQDLQFGRRGGGLRFLKYTANRRREVTLKASEVYSIRSGGRTYRLRYYRPTKEWFLIDLQAMVRAAQARLSDRGAELRRTLSDDERKARIQSQRRFLDEAAKKLKKFGKFQIAESEYTLIFTDYPPNALSQLARYSDQVCHHLNGLFGLPVKVNIWDGKVMIAAFSNRELLEEFEEQVMKNPNHRGGGSAHNGREGFLLTTIVERLDRAKATTICWGLATGYCNEIHSTLMLPSWINAGLPGWISQTMFPDPAGPEARKRRVAKQLSVTRSLGGVFQATRLDLSNRILPEQIVGFMIGQDRYAFGQFLTDIKFGNSLDEALMSNFNIQSDELALAFGRSLGIPNLTD